MLFTLLGIHCKWFTFWKATIMCISCHWKENGNWQSKDKMICRISSRYEYIDFLFFTYHAGLIFWETTSHNPVRFDSLRLLAFSKAKILLKERRLQTVDKIKENMMWQLMAIPKVDFTDSFEKWTEHWEKCVRFQREYFK